MSKLSEINRAFRANQPLEYILEKIAFAVQETTGFNAVLISVVKKDALLRIVGAGIPIPVFNQIRRQSPPISKAQDMMRPEFKISESYFIPAEKSKFWHNEYHVFVDSAYTNVEKPDDKTWRKEDLLLVPLNDSEGNMIGLLSVDAPISGKRPTLQEITVLELFANQAATAIENTNLFQELKHQAAQIRLFSQISSHISAILDPADLMEQVVNLISNAFNYYFVRIFQVDPQQPARLILQS